MIGTKILEERVSKYNGNIRVVNTWGMGTYIQSDGLTQSGGIVETIWKQTLKKIKNEKKHLSYEIKNVLILGLGGGTVAKLIQKTWSDAKIIGVDIDSIMVELGKKYLGLNEKDVQIVVQDAGKIPSGKFDLIVVDLYNGDKFPEEFENTNYLDTIRRHLIKGGIAVFNRLYYKQKREAAEGFKEKLKAVFVSIGEFRPISNIMFFCSG